MARIEIKTQKSIDNIKALIRELNDLKVSVSSVGQASATSMKNLETAINKVKSSTSKLKGDFKKLTTDLNNYKKRVDTLTASNKKLSNSFRGVRAGARGVGSSFKGMSLGIKDLIAGFGIVAGMQIFGQIIKNAFELTKTFDSLEFAMERVSKSSLDVSNNTAFLNEIVRDFGVDLVTTTNRYIKFLAAAQQSGITVKDTEDIFRSMTKTAGVLGLKTDELRGIYLALEQMLSKGKVTTEELRRQLGERLPGAMGIMAASMGVSITQLDKMMKKGEVLSADVLPGFAKAVELAFGIESVDKVETLVSSQNRLITSWQNWIKVISSDVGWLGKTFEWIADSINTISFSMMNNSEKVEDKISNFSKKHKLLLKEDAEFAIEENNKQMESYDDLEKRVIANREAQGKAYGEEKKILEEQGAELLAKQIKYAELRDAKEVELSEGRIKRAEQKWKESEIELDNLENELKVIEEKNEAFSIGDKLSKSTPTTGVERQIDMQIAKVANLKSEFLLYRKLVEKPSTEDPNTDPDGSTKKLRTINDLSNKLRIENLKRAKKYNEQEIESEEAMFTKKEELISANAGIEQRISELTFKDKVSSIESKYNEEIKGLEKTSERYIALTKEKNQKIEIAESVHKTKVLSIEMKYQTQLDEIRDEEFKKEVQRVDDLKKQLEIEKNNQLKIIRATSKSKKELKEREAKLNKLYFEVEKEQTIELYEEVINKLQKIGVNTKELEKILEKLKSTSYAPDLGDEDFKVAVGDWLELIRQLSSAIADIGDAIFERRIENINAEIQAEEDKYDKLIKLAEDDDSKKHALELQKEARTKALEKRRLREEQKQAKLRKAQALADIAISTAQAVLKNVALFGLPVGGAFNIATIALGALQAAAVLAQPIPQYKDGLDNAKNDHFGMINDGGSQEFLERDGKIFTSKKKNIIVPIKTGDTIYKDYDDMKKNSSLISILGNGSQLSSGDFSLLTSAITNSLDNGLEKFKVNNKVKINTNRGNDYGESLSRW